MIVKQTGRWTGPRGAIDPLPVSFVRKGIQALAYMSADAIVNRYKKNPAPLA